ncbi:MAG: class I SAM-dependent methyltransferase [Panacagrimonas sp.]
MSGSRIKVRPASVEEFIPTEAWAVRVRRKLRERYFDAFALRWLNSQFANLNHDRALRLAALIDGAEYAAKHMRDARGTPDKREVLFTGLQNAPADGLFMEFGVFNGDTINGIADRVKTTVHGFDSFEGLPEDWQGKFKKGAFHLEGQLPEVRQNVKLHVGWFDQSLPKFVAENPGPVSFVHVDCDLYSSTKTIFDFLGDRFVPGTVIVFDEYFNYPGWREHEYRAFQELIAARSLRYRYLIYNDTTWGTAAVQIVA